MKKSDQQDLKSATKEAFGGLITEFKKKLSPGFFLYADDYEFIKKQVRKEIADELIVSIK
jgi:hypothetical protein